jgi:hypothetical protein
MRKNPAQNGLPGMANFGGGGGNVSMMPGNTPQRLAPTSVSGPLGIPNGSSIGRLNSMPELPNEPQMGPQMGPMPRVGNDMGLGGMQQKLQGMMPQNFAQNPALGGLLQNPQLLQMLMGGMRGPAGNNFNRVR